jgi:hypothetical protein
VAKGLIKDGTWSEWAMDPVSRKLKVEHWLEYLTYEQLLELQKKAYRTFYLRPISIWRMIKGLRSLDELWIKIKGGFNVLGIKFNFSALKSKLPKSNNQDPIGNTQTSFKSK